MNQWTAIRKSFFITMIIVIPITLYILLVVRPREVKRVNEFNTKVSNELHELAEEAYFEGQRDAINGDVRIKLGSDSVYQWTKSPWNDGLKPQFHPTKKDTHAKKSSKQ